MTCNPETVVTSEEIANYKANLATQKTVIESNELTTTTPDGKPVDTLAGALQKLGWETPPILYAGGIVLGVDDARKVIEFDGNFYAPLPSQLPFTTSGTWVGDDENRFHLISYTDADNVAYNSTTVGEYLDNITVSTIAQLRANMLANLYVAGDVVEVTDTNRGGTFVIFPVGSFVDDDGCIIVAGSQVALRFIENNQVLDDWYGVEKNAPAAAAQNTIRWNAAREFAASNGYEFITSGTIYTNNTLFFEANSKITFVEPCNIRRDNDTTPNAYGLVDILSVMPISNTYKSGYDLSGKVKIDYVTDTAIADGLNFDNSSLCNLDNFYCWSERNRLAFYGKSCFGIKNPTLQGGNCYTTLKLDPTEPGSAGTSCTSLLWDVKSYGACKTYNIKNVTYSRFTGYCDGQLLSNPKLPANELPIGIYTRGGCRSVKFDVAFEQFQGVAIRQEAGQYCEYSFDTQIGTTVFEQDAARNSEILTAQQGIYSFAGAGTAIFDSCSVDYSSVTLSVPGGTYMFYCGTQANVSLNGGFWARGQYGWSNGPGNHLLSGSAARFFDPYAVANIRNNNNGTVTQHTVGTTAGGGFVTFNFPQPFTNSNTNELEVNAMIARGNGIGNITISAISLTSITLATDIGDGFVMRIFVTGKIGT